MQSEIIKGISLVLIENFQTNCNPASTFLVALIEMEVKNYIFLYVHFDLIFILENLNNKSQLSTQEQSISYILIMMLNLSQDTMLFHQNVLIS